MVKYFTSRSPSYLVKYIPLFPQQNILLRYGDTHNLNFALPHVANYFGGGRLKFEAGMAKSSPLNKVTPNIFAVHTKWDHEEVGGGGIFKGSGKD